MKKIMLFMLVIIALLLPTKNSEVVKGYSFTTYYPNAIGGYNGTDEYVHIPSYYCNEGVTTIYSYTFYNCYNLKGVTIPSGITTIEGAAFYNCPNLTSIAIPATVTSISEFAISGSSNITIYCEKGSVAYQYAVSNNFVTADINELTSAIQITNNKQNILAGQTITCEYTIANPSINEVYFYTTNPAGMISNTSTFSTCGTFYITAYNGMYSSDMTVTVTPATPYAPTNFIVTNDDYWNYNTLTWDYNNIYTEDYFGNIYYSTKFKIYRSTDINGEFILLDEISYDYGYDSYEDYDIEYGLTYYYKIETVVTYDSNQLVSDAVISSGICMPLEIPKINSIKPSKSHSITFSWDYVSNADGYYVYRSTTKNGNYKLIATLSADKSTTYIDKKLKLGQKYYYKVCTYVTVDGVNIPIDYSNTASETVRINAINVKATISTKASINTITWKKNKEADGYIVYYSKKYNGKYKKIKTINNKNKLTYTHKNLKNGTAYYYKVVAYKKIKGKKIIGIENEPYMKYCDYYTYADESYESRYQRLFGKSKTAYYSSSAKATQNMKTIKIKVWDLSSSGKKYTRTFNLTIHKNLAPSVSKMFKEIYDSNERFPIHDIGGYSWRTNNPGSEHCIGTALDINANENYMIDGGTILAGSLWKPKTNPYSIPLNCKLVKILNKYGFYRGFWGDRKDYMHFSYFGT